MNRRDLLDEIGTWLLSQLQPGEWTIRVRDDNPLAGSDDPDERHDVLFCVDTAEGSYRRTVQVHREWIDDAPAHGGSSYVIHAMISQLVVEHLRLHLERQIDSPIVLQHRPVGDRR